MPVDKQVHRHDYWRKLQAAKVNLMSRQGRQQTFSRLRQPKACSQVHSERRDNERNDEASAD